MGMGRVLTLLLLGPGAAPGSWPSLSMSSPVAEASLDVIEARRHVRACLVVVGTRG